MNKVVFYLLGGLLLAGCSNNYMAYQQYKENRKVFIEKMSAKYDFSAFYLSSILQSAKFTPQVLDKMRHPWEAKPWHTYHAKLVTAERIKNGKIYWSRHQLALKLAEQTYGIDPSVIVAIIGIESNYGQNQGNYSELSVLATLAFAYPPRAAFFQEELKEYLLLTWENNISPDTVKGSYAGAMGYPQFMPSSYRKYALDFNADFRSDLMHDTDDVIISVANYLKLHNWQKGEKIAIKANLTKDGYQNLVYNDSTKIYSVSQLEKYGITPTESLPSDTKVFLLKLFTPEGDDYWLALPNFQTIMRYNDSINYAMSVCLLAEAIKSQHPFMNN